MTKDSKTEAKVPTKDTVTCIVLKKGAGRISKGTRTGAVDDTYAKGATVELMPEAAAALEDRAFVSIQD